MTAWRWRDERGTAGGFEAIPFGFLVFVVGALVIANAWGVIDAKLAVSAAAREAARAHVEAASLADAQAAGVDAARAALAAHGRDPAAMTYRFTPAFQRCTRVSWTVSYVVPALVVPWLGGFGDGIEASATHSELVDPLRSDVPGEAGCLG